MLRKAGDMFREGILASNRAKPIGAGAYGVVYQSDVPGRVMKQTVVPDEFGYMTNEANRQAVAAELGIAPQVTSLERFPGGIGNRIEMQDIRDNYESVQQGPRPHFIEDPKLNLETAKQRGMLALRGVEVDDRHSGNVFKHKMTGRPMQIDFGLAYDLTADGAKAQALAEATADGFAAAGIPDAGDILRGIVFDHLEGGQAKEAFDVARQGFSRLQKIKHPLPATVDLLQG